MIHTHAFNRYVLALVLTLGGARSAISQVTPPTPPTTPGASSAQDTTLAKATSEAVAKTGDKLSVNYAVPEMPASAILGVTPATITRPITTKDFASSIIDGIDVDGHVRQGLAIETSLSMLRLSAFRVPLSKYQDSWWARFRSNLLLSFATVRVASDTQSTDIAWGVRAPIYDGGDPLAHREYTERLGQEMLQCAPATPIDGVPPGQQPGETVEEFLRRMNAAIATAATDTARRAKIAKRRE